MSEFTKQPTEKRTVAIEYAAELPSGVTVSSGTVSALDLDSNADASATVLTSTTATISGTKALVQTRAGSNGKDYKITFLTTLSNTDIWEDEITMHVKEK